MKKLMFIAAAALSASVFADIQSSNIVGYTGQTVEANKFYLLGVQFDKTGDSELGKVDMNDLVQLSDSITPGTYDSDFVDAPQIQVYTGAGYQIYFYISDATDENDKPLGYNCWADADGYELVDANKLIMGSGVWFKSLKAGSLTLSGQVKGTADAVVSFPANAFALLANPYPISFSLSDITTTGVTPSTYDSDFAGASQIQVYTGSGYQIYFYISDATDSDDKPVGYDCWADADGYILNGVNQVSAGNGFWVKMNAAGTLGFTK